MCCVLCYCVCDDRFGVVGYCVWCDRCGVVGYFVWATYVMLLVIVCDANCVVF